MIRPKFRVWDKEEQKWYVPTYKAYKKELHDIDIDLDGSLSIRTFDEFGKYVTIHESMFEGRYELLQSTGLFDKNGKEIFEGYILKVEYGDLLGETRETLIIAKNPFEYSMEEAKFLDFSYIVEIIGNKFEHPQLLGED